jgi:hypothetical protein
LSVLYFRTGKKMTQAPKTNPTGPNNRLSGRDVVPALDWNDVELLWQAARAATPTGATPPVDGGTSHARLIIDLFKKSKLPAPTYWAVVQWVRRGQVPDRWRPTLAYLLMRDQKIQAKQLFKRAKTPEGAAL